MEKCKLCLQEKQLIAKSHIIPDFMYEELYDDNHKIRVVPASEFGKVKPRIKMPSSGEYEGGLLCSDCDNKLLGGYENYARKAIYGGALRDSECPECDNFKSQDGVKFTLCKKINYHKFKIFLLSVLWRASISKRALFDQINLGPHEEVLRKMIYEGNPGKVDDYPLYFMTYVNDKDVSTDIIGHPKQIRIKSGHRAYTFLIGGIFYMYMVNSSDHTLPDYIIKSTIRPSDEMTIYHIPKGKGWEIMLSYFGLIKANI
ncbi:MAG: hypothetical protein V9G42_11865 [Bacteroidia bacterium]